jgi:hypothetical protein
MLAVAESSAGSLDEELPPYMVFDRTHLERWRGHVLVELADRAAEAPLRRAMDEMDSSFTRAGAAVRIDLAAALQARGEREEAGEHLGEAERLARRVRSRRQLTRLRRLRGSS